MLKQDMATSWWTKSTLELRFSHRLWEDWETGITKHSGGFDCENWTVRLSKKREGRRERKGEERKYASVCYFLKLHSYFPLIITAETGRFLTTDTQVIEFYLRHAQTHPPVS